MDFINDIIKISKKKKAEIIEQYCIISGDPDLPISEWLRTGAPLGALRKIPCVGVFPPASKRINYAHQPLKPQACLAGTTTDPPKTLQKSSPASSKKWSTTAGPQNIQTSSRPRPTSQDARSSSASSAWYQNRSQTDPGNTDSSGTSGSQG